MKRQLKVIAMIEKPGKLKQLAIYAALPGITNSLNESLSKVECIRSRVNRIYTVKEDNIMKLVIDVDELDLTSLVNELVAGSGMDAKTKDFIGKLNEKAGDYEKIKLVNMVLDWASENGLIQEAVEELEKNNLALKALGVKVRGIEIDE